VAAEPETGIITDEALTKAAGTENSDPGVAEKFLAADDGGDEDGCQDSAGEGGTREWYGDSAYGTGDLPWRDRRRRRRGRDQTQTLAGAGGGWVHRG
jgi:hypothetical protein